MTEQIETVSETWEQKRAREDAEAIATMRGLYEGIAAHLAGWRFEDRSEPECSHWDLRYYLVPETGATGMRIGLGIQKDKVNVSGYWPQRGPNDGGWTSPHDVRESSNDISCSLSRGYEAIAKDIMRRFLPEYTRVYNKLLEMIANQNAYDARRAANWDKLNSPVLEKRDPRKWKEQTGDLRLKDGYGHIHMVGEDSVSIEIRSVSTAMAQAVLNALAGLQKGAK